MEPTSPKKIQFSDAPSHQLDPQAAEHIRRRRPTPATLVIYQAQTGEEEARATGGVSDVSEGSQRKQSTYTPPIMKAGKQFKPKKERPLTEEEECVATSQDD